MICPPRILALSAMLFFSGCSLFEGEREKAACPAQEHPECPVCDLSLCPAPQVIEKIVEVPVATTAGELNIPIVGAVEYATVEPAMLRMEARIDTGAETTSIHAENIQLLERDGKRYVRFDLTDSASGALLPQELRLRRTVLIKQHESEPQRRFVVRMWITLGDFRSRVDVTLSDREDFEYPLLVGRNLLVDAVIVDVSRHHLLGN